MTLPASGAISLNNIQTEFGGANPIGLNEYYKGGSYVNAGVSASIPTSGTISIGNFYGASARITVNLTIASNAFNYDVYANRGGSYAAGVTNMVVTVNSGVRVGSTSTGGYSLLVPASFNAADTVTIINNGTIQGAGGTGGAGNAAAGAAAGSAVYVNRPTTITNNGAIYGGGGGGGGGYGAFAWGGCCSPTYTAGGGGGGGGSGYNSGAGGSGGAAGSGFPNSPNIQTPGSPGAPGSTTAGGGGGQGGANPGWSGGYLGIAGGAGGGYGASGGTVASGGAGGAAGKYIVGNAYVTWPATGTRAGGVA